MKAEITRINKIVDDYETCRGYIVVIETDERPNLKLGECEIKQ